MVYHRASQVDTSPNTQHFRIQDVKTIHTHLHKDVKVFNYKMNYIVTKSLAAGLAIIQAMLGACFHRNSIIAGSYFIAQQLLLAFMQ
jgi:hypothetical protein